MALCDILALFTTPIHSGIKDSTSRLNGSCGRCGESDQFHLFDGKKSPAFLTFGQRNESATCGTLSYTNVHWLSRGKCLSRLYELKNGAEIFLRENKNNLHVQFHNDDFVVMLAYLGDVFNHLNDINLSLQGHNVTISDVKEKLSGLTARIRVWQARIKIGSTTSFPLLERRLKMNRIDLLDNITTCIIEHLEIVASEF